MNVLPPHGRPALPGALLLSAALLSAPMACGSPGYAKAGSDPGDQRVMVVTTDSSDYCHTLSGAIAAHGALPREVKELKAQGDGLCDEGRVRSGIVRLRRALLMLHPGAASAPQGEDASNPP